MRTRGKADATFSPLVNTGPRTTEEGAEEGDDSPVRGWPLSGLADERHRPRHWVCQARNEGRQALEQLQVTGDGRAEPRRRFVPTPERPRQGTGQRRGVSDPTSVSKKWIRPCRRGRSRLSCRCQCCRGRWPGSLPVCGRDVSRRPAANGHRVRGCLAERSGPTHRPHSVPYFSDGAALRLRLFGSEGARQGFPHSVRRYAALTRAHALPMGSATIGASAKS